VAAKTIINRVAGPFSEAFMSQTSINPYEIDLDRNAANHVALSPLSFIRRTAAIYPNRTAVIHGPVRRTWAETHERCLRLGSALKARGYGLGDTVAVMAPNIPETLECHFGIPFTGAVLNALNIRLDADAIAFILKHSEAKVLITDREFSKIIAKALDILGPELRPLVVDIDDPQAASGQCLGDLTYEALLAEGDPDFAWSLPEDEWQAISLNYTSGTTGNPKGVVYHHRGAYLTAVANVLTSSIPHHPVYLWTLPMFHCNGWCFPWTITLQAGTHVCLRSVTAKGIFDALADHQVTLLCGAAIVMGMMVNAPDAVKRSFRQSVQMLTGGAPPPAAVIGRMEALGISITHLYGLTESYGPSVYCAWQEDWSALSPDQQAVFKSRQGVPYPVLDELMVADPSTMTPVPSDGQSIGEVFLRGNVIMRGYLKNPVATKEAFGGGWFHTGDLGVMHENGYIELKDRSKDIIISGGENISTIEVESILYRHEAVQEVAVVARPDERWGETPCAFVTLRPGAEVSEKALIAYCREHLAHFKCPRTIIFSPLPKTSTGKIQKYVLRQQARTLDEIDPARR
jgi:fatty-acyl-CoA synthase